MEQTTGPTGIVMMDHVSKNEADGGSYYLPGVIVITTDISTVIHPYNKRLSIVIQPIYNRSIFRYTTVEQYKRRQYMRRYVKISALR